MIELLMVIALLAVLAGLVLPSTNPSLHDQLRSAASLLRTDLAYGRSLAVCNNSTYRIAFEMANNRYVLEHSNEDQADLDILPESPFRRPDDPPTQHIVDLNELPRMGSAVQLVTVLAGDPPQPVADVEFDSLGQTTRTDDTKIWLAVGHGPDTRYVWLKVTWETGLVEIGEQTSTGPPGATP